MDLKWIHNHNVYVCEPKPSIFLSLLFASIWFGWFVKDSLVFSSDWLQIKNLVYWCNSASNKNNSNTWNFLRIKQFLVKILFKLNLFHFIFEWKTEIKLNGGTFLFSSDKKLGFSGMSIITGCTPNPIWLVCQRTGSPGKTHITNTIVITPAPNPVFPGTTSGCGRNRFVRFSKVRKIDCMYRQQVLVFTLYVAITSSSISSCSAPHTWTRPSIAVRRRVSVGWKDRDWTTAFPTGSFNDKDPWK